MTANLAARLRRHLESDHQRGCAGRQYACSCGYDAATEELLALAADALANTELSTDIVEGAFYWALAYGEEKEPTVVQRLNAMWWLPGFEDGLRDHQLRIIEKIEPPKERKS